MSPEPTTEHKVLATAGTYYGQPWLYLNCQGCKWRLGFAADCDPAELAVAAESHRAAALRTGDQLEPMTEAEQAAADVMRTECVTEGVITTADPESFDRTVRAVVAAVRPLIEADTLDRFADHLRALVASETFCEEAGDLGMKYAASEAEDEAAALRTTTPEKEN